VGKAVGEAVGKELGRATEVEASGNIGCDSR